MIGPRRAIVTMAVAVVVVVISKVYVADTAQVNWHCRNWIRITVNFVFSQRWWFMRPVSFIKEKHVGIAIIIICV